MRKSLLPSRKSDREMYSQRSASHVMFFLEFLDEEKERVKIVDSTRSTGKVSVREEKVSELFAKGYEIYRKN